MFLCYKYKSFLRLRLLFIAYLESLESRVYNIIRHQDDNEMEMQCDIKLKYNSTSNATFGSHCKVNCNFSFLTYNYSTVINNILLYQ